MTHKDICFNSGRIEATGLEGLKTYQRNELKTD
jgi:hypothetical protein